MLPLKTYATVVKSNFLRPLLALRVVDSVLKQLWYILKCHALSLNLAMRSKDELQFFFSLSRILRPNGS